MLAAAERLTRRRDFAAVYGRKRSWSSPLVAMYLCWHNETEPDVETRRFGFVVSKKVSKNAHDRNRIKRRLREICRTGGEEWRRGFDVVFVARSAAVDATYRDLEAAIQHLARRGGLVQTTRALSGSPER